MSKITNIPSEIRNFFSEKRRSVVMDTFTRLLEGLNLDSRSLGGLKRENCQLTNLLVFQILLPFDYLLVDSWFTCTELVYFVYRRHKKFHLLGMAKMGNTKYLTIDWGELSAKAIITKLKAKKAVKYSRRYRCHYAEFEVML